MNFCVSSCKVNLEEHPILVTLRKCKRLVQLTRTLRGRGHCSFYKLRMCKGPGSNLLDVYGGWPIPRAVFRILGVWH